jgi:hypothetical protein
MYQPESSFLKKLKRLDPKLGCKYEPSHQHFVITYQRPIGDPVNVLLIESAAGGFRWPNDRDIEALQRGDLQRVSMKDRLKQVAKHMEDERAKSRRTARDNFRNMTKDDRRQLMPAFARLANAGGKNNSVFRRINLAPRGQVFR